MNEPVTSYPPEEREQMPGRPDSQTAEAVKTGVAAVLLCTGVALLLLRLLFDGYELIDGKPLEKPGSFVVGMMYAGLVLPLVAIGSIAFTIYISFKRCRDRGVANLTAMLSLGVMCLPLLSRVFALPLPAFFLGTITRSSVGWYLGVVIQFIIAAWLLGWLDRSKRRDVPPLIRCDQIQSE